MTKNKFKSSIVIRRLTILSGFTVNFKDQNDIASVTKALAHPARVKIVQLLLSRTSCVGGEITSEVGLAQSTVSEHLRILKSAGIVVGEIEHPRVCYSLNVTPLLPLIALLQQVSSKANKDDGLCCALENKFEDKHQ